ncbi:MAG: glycosyltransferase family 2 protein [Bryobacterales bacterium]|nr:glycosyltransferase family 2 protein [Bryobacterales bacterium]
MTNLPSYILITPARNEAQGIELTIRSVISQTARPRTWIIVNDGSTDETADIVRQYTVEYPWIELLQMPERTERDFAGKVLAFNAGYERIKNLTYDAVGSLDADISFEPEYFNFLLKKLSEDQRLGLVGTRFSDPGSASYDYRIVSIEHVSGACQLFRRQCFEDIGGYVPVKGGGIDRIANIAARLKGWKTRTFTEKCFLHHRPMGTAQNGRIGARFKDGVKDYAVGTHPVWMLFRVLYQMRHAPYIIAAAALASGYLWSYIVGRERPVSRELVEFNRQEQMRRLKQILTGRMLGVGSHDSHE